ncbi:MAG: homocysteine S-methyltransferase family protein [Allosphingosinicella sp.]|uniref:homocysteine S-methyltransferase family protein n=1 Tax=Allosphingosinicella sp. TaxID=2823234 RepID=UPI003964642C
MSLPQLERTFLTDGGLETDLIFNLGVDLPCFASITLMSNEAGRAALTGYFRPYLELAATVGTGFILESPTWRASPDWATPLGLSVEELDRLNVAAVEFLQSLRAEWGPLDLPILVSGCIGPRGDGYNPARIMSPDEAEAYHVHQTQLLASCAPDMLCALTINNVNEAIGIARAAGRTGLPFALSFTVETDGRLPTGEALGDAIDAVDTTTGSAPAYYMINCAHPTHFEATLDAGQHWTNRIRGIRANASTCSHSELEAMTELDTGNPDDLGARYRALLARCPQIRVLGGCCGTDVRHVASIARACIGSGPGDVSG